LPGVEIAPRASHRLAAAKILALVTEGIDGSTWDRPSTLPVDRCTSPIPRHSPRRRQLSDRREAYAL